MSDLIITDGTSQQDRIAEAVREGYFNVDELRLEDLMAMAIDYARLLEFYNAENAPSGDWEAFFTGDEISVMALILALDEDRLKSGLTRFLDLVESNNFPLDSPGCLQDMPAYRLAKNIDWWLKLLETATGSSGERLREEIVGLIERKLAPQLGSLQDFLAQHNPGITGTLEREFSPLWARAAGAAGPVVAVPPPGADRATVSRFLKHNFHYFFNAISALKHSAGRHLPDALKSQSHGGAMGLYIAFVMLYQRAQKKVNGFTRKHLRFYYHDVLRMRPRGLVPDSTFLVFHTDGKHRNVPVPAGTEFSARVPGTHASMLYRADNELLLNDAKVASLCTLFFERNALSSPECKLPPPEAGAGSRQFVTGAKRKQISPVPGTGRPPAAEVQSWPLFGAPKKEGSLRLLDDAAIGFAVASPVLLLQEGQRDIEVSLKFDYLGTSDLDFLFDYLAGLGKTTKEDVFFKVFREMFKIELTGPRGWLAVSGYLPSSWLVDETCAKDSLKFRIGLSPQVDPVVPYAPEIHGHGYHTELPLIRFVINPGTYLYPYSLLQDVMVKEIEIRVDVKGVKQIKVYGETGPLSAEMPFHPFGPYPSVGSYFLVGNAETTRKQLTHFAVELEWANLPSGRYGLRDWYEGYGEVFDRTVFVAGISVLKGGRWLPDRLEEQPATTLFAPVSSREHGAPDAIDKRRTLSCDGLLRLVEPTQEVRTHESLVYHSGTRDGFFKFTLLRPEYAFGHKLYPVILANVLSANARLKKVALHRPVPNPPYLPVVNSISIHYSAVSSIHPEHLSSHEQGSLKEKIFHIHPFGTECLSAAQSRRMPVVPVYASAGNLFIGLSARERPGTVTLLFHLRDDSIPMAGGRSPGFSWHYLASNRWKRMPQGHVLADTTHGFLSSGIVTLSIPADIDTGNTIMPGDLYWLRVSAEDHAQTVCSLISLQAQALQVTWKPGAGDAAHLAAGLPAGSIADSRVSLPGVLGVEQIGDSFGGRPPESGEHLVLRTRERLRHKQRATTPWDYERLILERFPEIVKVKCFSNMVAEVDPCKRVRPGHVLIVVIPSHKGEGELRPMANAFLLDRIRTLVEKLASPLARIEVRNPAYEQIQVRCTVTFRSGAKDGYHIRSLNRAIREYLSPWSSMGYSARFGWRVRCYDIESYLTQLEYVDFVTNFSMLHIAQVDERKFLLFDTARERSDEIRPYFPWSIGIPLEEHFIQTADAVQPITPEVTGVGELEIGSTFIFPQRQDHGEEK